MSGTTVTLYFLKKSMPRMGSATAACKKLDVKSLPWNCTVFLMKPQEGIGCPSAPLRRGRDGLEFWLQGTILKVAPVSIKYLSFVNSSIRKINLALARKCIAVAVACMGMAAEPRRWFGGYLVFRPSTGRSAPVSHVGVIVVKFTYTIARVLKRIEIRAGRRPTFRTGVAILFVPSLPRRLRLWGRGRLEHPRGHPRPSPWLRLTCGCQLLLLLAWNAEGE